MLPTQNCLKLPRTTPTVKNFCRGSPNNARNGLIRAFPARENFGTRKPLRFVGVQLAKTAALSSFTLPSSQFEVATHSERLSMRRNFPQTTGSAVARSHISTNQHTRRLKRVFSTSATSARNRFHNSYATESHLMGAPPTRAQQVTSEINQDDHHEHEDKDQRHYRRSCWQLRLEFVKPPPWDDGRGHHDENDRAK